MTPDKEIDIPELIEAGLLIRWTGPGLPPGLFVATTDEDDGQTILYRFISREDRHHDAISTE